ncbi:PfkB family carbohydrate kinase [Acidisphaera sp. L21]|uniref:PfkB family carbohydrate kinase n=1 Tax=Acidisphaera sp. L21 TaxID=1641851 RepID=UPI00131BC5E4|nr:PfkB family carbohydrate kinase [Acidisphaera sp. L21]
MSRVHVLGNAGMDLGLTLPHMPAPGETVVGNDPHRAPGGKGLNQAVAAVRCGAVVRFLAPLGDDPEAAEIAAALQAETFDALELPRFRGASDRSILMLTPDGENCIVSLGACGDGFEPAAAAGFAAEVGPKDILLMQGNLSFAATRAAAAACAGRVVLNTAPMLWDVRPLLPRCAIVVANAVEARAITGSDRASALRDAGAGIAIVTLGGNGCRVADDAGEQDLPPCPADLVDSTGAGDAFCGALAAVLGMGWPLMDAIAAAQRVAARTVERRGAFAAIPPPAECASLLRRVA